MSGEEHGTEVQVADRIIRGVVAADGDDGIDVFHTEKNSDFVIGAAEAPKRIRHCPNLGYNTVRKIASWLVGRLNDAVRKNLHSTQQGQRMLVGTIDAVAEILLLGHSCARVSKALRFIRDPGLLWLRGAALGWLRLDIVAGITPKEIQDRVWQFRRSQNLA